MKILSYIRTWIKELSAYHINMYSANAAFYIILSVFPGIMLLMTVLPYFGFHPDDLLESLKGLIPEILAPLMERVFLDLEKSSDGFLLSATAMVAVWSSSRGIYCVQKGLNAIIGIRDTRPYFVSRILSMVYMLFFLLALLLTLIVNGFGKELAAYFSKQPVPLLQIIGKLLQLRGLLLCLVLCGLFITMYCILPDKKQSVKLTLPGATLASVSWLIFTAGYSFYARNFGSYSVLYGSLSIIAMGMFWLYICVSILFYGCLLNLYLERSKH